MPTYDVYLWEKVCHTVTGVEADSKEDAIEQAKELVGCDMENVSSSSDGYTYQEASRVEEPGEIVCDPDKFSHVRTGSVLLDASAYGPVPDVKLSFGIFRDTEGREWVQIDEVWKQVINGRVKLGDRA